MKGIILFSLFIISSFLGRAQVTTLTENFDATCGTTSLEYPAGWTEYNIIPNVDSLSWRCNATKGRSGTPGMRCLGYYSGSYHLDTAWLFTPQLNVSGYPGDAFLRFDSKYEVGIEDFRLAAVHLFYGYGALSVSSPLTDTTHTDSTTYSTMAPIISNADSFGWVTHEVNLTPYKTYPSIYIAFRYVSTNMAAGAWAIDNIYTTTIPLNVQNSKITNSNIQLTGSCIDNQLIINYSTPELGKYYLALYDITGKEVVRKEIETTETNQKLSLPSNQCSRGLHILKMWNETHNAVVKVAVY